MPARLLIIDDDQELTALLRELLGQEGFDVESHPSGQGAAALATVGGYAMVILDVMLPEKNGFEVLKEIRRASSLPVILLTARGADIDRIVGLEIGADDYVPKPFNARELTARIRAVLRRLEPRPPERLGGQLNIGDLTLIEGSRAVLRDGSPIELTTVEFDILRLLLESAGQTVTRDRISEQILGRLFDPYDRSVDMHISKLRRKLGPRSDEEDRIKTIRGVGYIYTLPLAR